MDFVRVLPKSDDFDSIKIVVVHLVKVFIL